MTYTKPELSLLGDAHTMIRGSKNGPPEPADLTKQQASAFELED